MIGNTLLLLARGCARKSNVEKKVLFFTEQPPVDREAIHIWLGKTALPHEQSLRRLIGQYLGAPPPQMVTGPTGKLYLPDSPLHFNLSDADDWIAMAFSWEAPVGIDIETIRPIEGMEQVITDCFSPKEQAYVQEKDTLVRFWQIWNRKEACLKALGLGLQDDMRSWDCSGQDWISVDKVWVRSLPAPHNLSAAVAITAC